MYQNGIYICIFWYSNTYWFPMKKCWCQQNSKGVSRDSYIFWVFFSQGITVPSFMIVGYVWQISGRWGLFGSPIREQPRKDPSWIGLNYSYFHYIISCLKDNSSAIKYLSHLFYIFLVLAEISHDLTYQKLLISQEKCLKIVIYLEKLRIFFTLI